MNKTKKISSLVLVFLILITSSTVFAIEPEKILNEEYSINSTSELIETFKLESENGELKSEDSKEILENTDPIIIKEYNNYLEEEVINAMSELSNESEMQFDINDSKEIIKTNSIELNDGTIIELTETIGDVDQTLSKFNLIFNVASVTGTHNYGSRYYQCKYNIKYVGYPDTVCSLYTYFNASKSSGFTATSTSTAGSSTVAPTTLSKSSRITDSRAERVGYDINGQGDYNATIIGYNGVGIVSYDISMVSTIRLDALNSTTYKSTAWNTIYK